MEHLLIILYKKRMRDLIWLINIMRVLCRAVCFCFTIDCNFLFIACLHARTIYWLVAKKYAIRDNGKGRHEKNRRRVRLCRSETDWSASSTCYMVMATIDICLMLINFAKYFANSWCASIHHYISLFHIFYDQFFACCSQPAGLYKQRIKSWCKPANQCDNSYVCLYYYW